MHNSKKDLRHIEVSGSAQGTVKHLLGLTERFLLNWIGGLSQGKSSKLRLTKIRNIPEIHWHGPLKAILLYIEINKRIQVAQFCGDDPSKAVSGQIKVCQAFNVAQLSWYGAN